MTLHRRHRWRDGRRRRTAPRQVRSVCGEVPGGGGPAIIGPGVPADAAAPGAAVWPATGVLGAAGGGAEPEADAGVTFAAAGGGAGA